MQFMWEKGQQGVWWAFLLLDDGVDEVQFWNSNRIQHKFSWDRVDRYPFPV